MHRQMHRTDVVPELAGRRSMSLVARSKNLKLSSPRASHAHLPSNRLINLTSWSTSPRVYNSRRSIQPADSRTNRLGDQSPSIKRSVVGAVPTNLSTSPRASSARWSVHFLKFRVDRLGNQSPSIKCSVVGAVLEVPS